MAVGQIECLYLHVSREVCVVFTFAPHFFLELVSARVPPDPEAFMQWLRRRFCSDGAEAGAERVSHNDLETAEELQDVEGNGFASTAGSCCPYLPTARKQRLLLAFWNIA